MSNQPSQYAPYISSSPYGMETHGWSNVRSYGVLSLGSMNDNNIITEQSYQWNRLQPLNKPFGTYPPNCQANTCQPSGETTLAWACPSPNVRAYPNSPFNSQAVLPQTY